MPHRFASTVRALATLAIVTPALAAQHDSFDAPKSMGFEVRAVIEPDSLDRATFSNLAELLQARVPGLSVTRRGNGSTRLHMRGPASLYSENAPLLVIDGIRVSMARSGVEEFVGRPNPLDDIDVEQIERIEIVTGPSAAALYGTGAANGVITVATRAAHPTPTQWRAFLVGGGLDEPGSYPANFARLGTYSGGGTDICRRIDEANDRCTPTGTLTSFNPLEDEHVVGAAALMKAGGSVSGGSEQIAWSGAATLERQGDLTDAVTQRRTHAHFTTRVRTSSTTDLMIRAHWMEGATPLATPAFESLRQQGLLHYGLDTSWTGFRRYPEPEHDLSRRGLSLAAGWRATAWLRGSVITGLDRSSGSDRINWSQTLGTSTQTRRDYVRQRRTDFTGRADVEATYGLGARMRGRTIALVEAIEHRRDDLFEQRLTFDGAFTERWMRMRDDEDVMGIAVHQEVVYANGAALQLALRHEDLDTFGLGWKTPWYPHASVVWFAVPERAGAIGGVRLRAAYGKAGTRPSMEPLLFSFPSPWQEPLERKVEVSTEREGGLDVSVLGQRADVSITWYSKRTTDVWMSVPGPSYTMTGFGEVLNRGVEGSVRLRLLNASRAAWDVRVTYAHNHNELANALGFGSLIAPVSIASSRQVYHQSAPLGAHVVWPVAFADDRDGDGVLESACFVYDDRECEVHFAANPQYRAAFPPTELGIESTFRVGPLTVGVLVDHRQGHYVHNVTEAWRCLGPCAMAYATSLSYDDAIRLATTDYHQMLNSGAFVEDGSFTKLRELSLRADAPSAWARGLGARRLHISLAGRNLATWTNYSGMDPEASSFDDTGLAVGDFASAPLPRSVSLRLTLTQ